MALFAGETGIASPIVPVQLHQSRADAIAASTCRNRGRVMNPGRFTEPTHPSASIEKALGLTVGHFALVDFVHVSFQ